MRRNNASCVGLADVATVSSRRSTGNAASSLLFSSMDSVPAGQRSPLADRDRLCHLARSCFPRIKHGQATIALLMGCKQQQLHQFGVFLIALRAITEKVCRLDVRFFFQMRQGTIADVTLANPELTLIP